MSDHEKDDTRELEPDKIPEELVRVQELPDEATGTMLCDFLGDQGIKATVQPVQIAWMPGVETMRHGYWGYLEVLERDVSRARTLIDDFFAGRPERGSGTAGASGASTGGRRSSRSTAPGAARPPRDSGGDDPEDAA